MCGNTNGFLLFSTFTSLCQPFIAQKRKVGAQSIVVKKVATETEFSGCNILYIPEYKSGKIDEIVVATTVDSRDEPLEKICKKLQVPCFRGSEEDVLLVEKFLREEEELIRYSQKVKKT